MNVHNTTFTSAGPAMDHQPPAASDRLRRMSRHPLLIVMSTIMAIAGIAIVVSYIQSKPATLKIATGARHSEDYRLVQQLAQYLGRERAPVRLQIIRQDAAQNGAELIDRGTADLAVVRRDVAMPKTGQVVAVHRRNVVVLMVPPAPPAPPVAAAPVATPAAPAPAGPATKTAKKAASKSAKNTAKNTAKSSVRKSASASKEPEAPATEIPATRIAVPEAPKPIEKIEDLQGKTIAIVGRTAANVTLLHTILAQYSVPADKITTIQFGTEDLTAQLRHATFDALLTVGPIGSKITAEAVAALARGKEPPVFLEVGSSEAIEQQNPVYESTEIPAGAFGGSRPAEAVETIGVSHYIVARRSLDDGVVGNFTKWLFNAKQTQGTEFPAFARIASPDTDKAATLAVHPGALAYLEGEQQTFFDRYSEPLYWSLMLVSIFGSGAAWLFSYIRSSPSKYERRNDLEALISILKRARTAAAEELDLMCIEIDDIVERAIRQIESGAIHHNRSSAVTLAADQARRAVAERRALLAKA